MSSDSSPQIHQKLDFRDNTTLRIAHEATLHDLLSARNYAALQLLEERNALLREREELGATKIIYNDYEFLKPPNPAGLLPYIIIPPSPTRIMPLRVTRPPWAYYPVDRHPVDASTQTDDPDTTLTEIELTLVAEVKSAGKDKKRKLD